MSRPTMEQVKTLCRVGQGSACCRYLVGDNEGFDCGKVHAGLRATLDKRVADNNINARGDNCPGLFDEVH